MEILARTAQATRTYGSVVALDNVTLDVPAGQLLGLLGPNGAGKTTLLQLLAGLRRPTSGTVEIFGGDPRDAAPSPPTRVHPAGDRAAPDAAGSRGRRLRRRPLRRPGAAPLSCWSSSA